MNVEDTSLLEDMRKVQELVKEILENKSGEEENKTRDDVQMDSKENDSDFSEADGLQADDDMKSPEIFEKSKPGSRPGSRDVKKGNKRRKSEVEKLLEDETKISPEHANRSNRRRKKNPHIIQNNDKMSSTKMVKNSANTSQLIITNTKEDENQETTAAAWGVTGKG